MDDKVLETYSNTILKSLQDRIKELKLKDLPPIRKQIKSLQVKSANKSVLKKSVSREEFDALIQLRKALEREQKNARRSVGALIQNKPEVYRSVIEKIQNEGITGRAIGNAIKVFQARPTRLGGIGHDYDKLTGKVGHAPVGLNVLPDAMEKWLQPFSGPKAEKTRLAFLEAAEKANLRVGDEVLNFIDPAAHKPFALMTTGVLEKRFGSDAKKIPPEFLETLYKKQAHAKLFGGTSGFQVPAIDDLKGLDPNAFLETVKPYLELPYMGNKSASELEKVLMNSQNLSTEDLSKAIDNIPVDPKATELSERLGFLNKVSKKDLIIAEETGQIAAASKLSNAPNPLVKNLSKITNNPAARRTLALGGIGGGVLLSGLGVDARAQEVQDNPNDPWLKAQLKIDKVAHNLDKVALGGTVAAPATGGTSLAPAAAAETGSLVLGGLSLGMDATRSLKKNFVDRTQFDIMEFEGFGR